MINIPAILELQYEAVVRWHQQPIDNPYEGFFQVVCMQHSFNYRLWHEEDIARSPDVTDVRIAEVKRNIDKLNQQRNDWIERLDDWLTDQISALQIVAIEGARQNTETPGSAIDRLSILALRIYHLEEQRHRTGVSAEHLESVSRKVAICRMQRDDLSRSLKELVEDIAAGQKRHKTYRQFKMYNDPTLNPYLYGAKGERKA